MRDEIGLVWIMIKVELIRSCEVSGKLEIIFEVENVKSNF
jgi:hypothetical protein